MRYIAIALMLMGCQTRSKAPNQIITANECRTACYPNAMISVEVMSGSCKCQLKGSR